MSEPRAIAWAHSKFAYPCVTDRVRSFVAAGAILTWTESRDPETKISVSKLSKSETINSLGRSACPINVNETPETMFAESAQFSLSSFPFNYMTITEAFESDWAYAFYSPEWIGTFQEMLGIFAWGFGLDITVEALAPFLKKLGSTPSSS